MSNDNGITIFHRNQAIVEGWLEDLGQTADAYAKKSGFLEYRENVRVVDSIQHL
jgi:hypothetical protein